MFSLSSLGLSFSMTPFMFIVESNLPMSARAVLAFTAISTTSISTGLLAWASSPYVTSALLSKLPTTGAVQEMEVKTLTLWFKPRTTRIFDPTFLVGTNRPFANLELAQLVFLPPALRNTTPGQEETVAETTDEKGEVIGRWVVKWAEGGEGSCHEVGKVIRRAVSPSMSCLAGAQIYRHFNVHKELLPPLVLVDAPADGVATKS
ncbi:unnamed protein product [Mycena citricolor]|uniref:Uncharacterized protein n=1 Tax=Mycena citricolor TaxID=2018698 RepID=A0AAD2HWD5_9AGAR|nr:unnamed protein product [Mycena citricolor]